MKDNLNRLNRAWTSAPPGTKTLLFKTFPKYTSQNVRDILLNGRKDSEKITILLNDLKATSKELTDNIIQSNKKVQKI